MLQSIGSQRLRHDLATTTTTCVSVQVPSLLSPAPLQVGSEGAGPGPTSPPLATRGTETPETKGLQRGLGLPSHTGPGTWLPGCRSLYPSPPPPLGTTAGVGVGEGRGGDHKYWS